MCPWCLFLRATIWVRNNMDCLGIFYKKPLAKNSTECSPALIPESSPGSKRWPVHTLYSPSLGVIFIDSRRVSLHWSSMPLPKYSSILASQLSSYPLPLPHLLLNLFPLFLSPHRRWQFIYKIYLRLFILYIVFWHHVCPHSRRGHQISLSMVMSNHDVVGSWTQGIWNSS